MKKLNLIGRAIVALVVPQFLRRLRLVLRAERKMSARSLATEKIEQNEKSI